VTLGKQGPPEVTSRKQIIAIEEVPTKRACILNIAHTPRCAGTQMPEGGVEGARNW